MFAKAVLVSSPCVGSDPALGRGVSLVDDADEVPKRVGEIEMRNESTWSRPIALSLALGVLGGLSLALPGCPSKEGPAERAGAAVDDAVESVGDAAKDAGDAVEDALDK